MKSKKALATEIVRTLRSRGFEAYFVGGCVRDTVLRKTPYDYDISTNAQPKDIRKIFAHTVPVGEAFGVMIVRVQRQSFEVSTFRSESGYEDGRRPTQVAFTDAKTDASRRDFTVNGLYYDPIKRKTLDWVDGVRDIRKKVIRTIGDPLVRFEEDKLRMLRAVRFAANLGFKIEAKTLKAIQKMHKQIFVVSMERIRDELVKMFTGPNPMLALDGLDKTKLLPVILPEIEKLKGVQQPRQFHPEGDVYKHTRKLLGLLKRPPLILAFGCLLHDIGKPATFYRAKDRIRFNGHDRVGAGLAEKLLTKLKFSNEQKRQIVDCVDGHMRFKDAPHMKASTLKRLFQRDTFETELEQHRVDCLASHGDLTIYKFLKKKLGQFSKEDIRPELFLKGRDLIELGFVPGPRFGKILREAEEKQLDGAFRTKQDALNWAAGQRK